MKLYMAGAEKATNRNALVECGVTRFALDLSHFSIPKRKTLDLPGLFGPDAELVVFTSPTDQDTDRFDSFLRDHHGDVDRVVGRGDYNGRWLGERWWPMWDDDDIERFTHLAKEYRRVTVSDKVIEDDAVRRRMSAIAQRWDAQLMVLSSKQGIIGSHGWDSAIVGSWTSPRRFGETQVWDGRVLRRFPKQQKITARKSMFREIEALGVDPETVLADDLDAVNVLAIRSWLAFEASLQRGATPGAFESALGPVDDETGEIVANESRPESGVPADLPIARVANTSGPTRHVRERKLLPGITREEVVVPALIGDDEGSDQGGSPTTELVIRHASGTMRSCDSCLLAARCPEFDEHATCAFEIPVTLGSKNDRNRAFTGLLEMQLERIDFARFAEQIEGQVLDESVDKAIDRFFKWAAAIKELNEDGSLVRMTQTIEARGGQGVISRFFGAEAGAKAQALPGGGLAKPATDRFLDALAADG